MTRDVYVAVSASFLLSAVVVGFFLWRVEVLHDVPLDAEDQWHTTPSE